MHSFVGVVVQLPLRGFPVFIYFLAGTSRSDDAERRDSTAMTQIDQPDPELLAALSQRLAPVLETNS